MPAAWDVPRGARAAAIVFCLAGIAGAQGTPLAPDADLETIRDWAASRMTAQTAAFKDMLQRSIPILQSTLGDETTVVRETIARLAARAALQPGAVVAAMQGTTSAPLRRRLSDVLVGTGDPSIGGALLEAAEGADEELAAVLIQTVGRLQSKDMSAALAAKLQTVTSPLLLGEIVVALARLESKEALPAARKLLEHADPKARERGTAALGVVGQKEDVEPLKKLATASDPALRAAAIRALGRFKGNLDALRTLHDAVTSTDPTLVKAALDALEQAGTKELTPHFLLPVVKTGPLETRERAARLLLRFGNAEGIRIIVQQEKSEADKAPGNRNAQVAMADRCRELGWFEGAIPYYDRALSARSGDVPDQQILVALARCYARLKRYDDAKRKLRDARYVSLKAFADDPDFAEMRENPAHRESFK
jgi:HEAT repeat protein